MNRRLVSLSVRAAVVLAVAGMPAHADTVDPWDGDWHGSITPYGWLPGVTGETRFQLPNKGKRGQ
ncbi:hypothetical protein EC912_104384 [Luteibacter rhizovicinus]|uniref:Uncharacterized protein n=1 Tax=Luteibacter rhizovicinus TaxID=242606 RepID=A0A4R3YPD4_9GAMM|nr:hypothetical protein [Luteibacter rhizovicinus]TCV94186.1 hypothetical protein EC912_104384 [Luteibacter rhizovicinus]